MNKNYYKILELEPGCTTTDIKNAYRRLAKKFHPDINKSSGAQQQFIDINEAYEILLRQLGYRNINGKEKTEYENNYDEFIRKVREAAQQRARMRYEKFIREHEAFRESGLYDVVLILKYIGFAILPFLAFGFLLLPIILAIINKEGFLLLSLFYFWIFGISLFFIIYQKRKNYFKLGKFYYNIPKIRELFAQMRDNADNDCFFCKGYKANSIPYKISFYKITSINLQNKGPLQHYAGYKRKVYKETLPRSQKAFIVHSIVTFIKLSSILFSLFLIHIDSLIWRIILGFFIGWFISSAILLVTKTKSKVGYLFSWGILIKIAIWLGLIAIASNYSIYPFNIRTTDYIQFIITVMAFGDAFIEQLLKLPYKMKIFKPILKSYSSFNHWFDNNYILYFEIPIWTALYPIIRWIF